MNKIITNGVSGNANTAYVQITSGTSSTDNAIVRWDGTTGRYIQNSNIILDDAGNMSMLESGVQYGYMWVNNTNNSAFVGSEIPYTDLANFENCTNTVVVGSGGTTLNGASNTIVIGAGSGAGYTGVSNTICIGNAGSAGVADADTIRIGDAQNRCFIAGIYDKVLVGADPRMVVTDETGKLGTTSSYLDIPTYESTTVTPATTPVAFGPLTVHLARVGKLVTCVIEPQQYDFTGSPTLSIDTLGGIMPTSYYPVDNIKIPMIYKVNGVYDTGLVGHVIVGVGGGFSFVRDGDGAPSEFDGISGWGWAMSLSWITA